MLTNSFTAEFEISAPHDDQESSATDRAEQLVRETFETHSWGISSKLNSIDSSSVVDNSGDSWIVEVDFTVRFDSSPEDIKKEFVNDVHVCRSVSVN